MAAQLTPAPVLRVYDNSGNLAIGGSIFTYIAGTSTPLATYTDASGTTPNANPTILNSRGECSLWLATGQSYKITAFDASSNLLWTKDSISNTAAITAAIITNGAQVVPTIATLRTLLKTSASVNAIVTGYYAAGDGGGGTYWYDSTDTTSSDNGGSIIVAADGGRWKLQVVNGTVSAKQFGAKKDGVSDDGGFINAALNAFLGGTVLVPAGTYYLNTPVVIPTGTILRGAGITQTIFTHGTGAPNSDLVKVMSNSIIEQIAVDGNQANVTTFSFAEISTGGVNATVRRCKAFNTRNIGISAGTDYARIQENIIIGISSATIGGYGIWGVVPTSIDQEISGNVVSGTYIDGIGASGIGLRIFNNYVSGCQCNTAIGGGQIAIYPMASNTGYADVYDNYVGAGGSVLSSGLELNGWTNAHGNTIVGQKLNGIVLQAGANLVVDGNVVRNTNGPGIVVTGALVNFSIRNNTCYDDQATKTQTYGIRVMPVAASAFSITGNTVFGNLTASLLDGSTGNPIKKIFNNAGYTVATTLTVGASPYTYTNTRGETTNLYIYNGTVSSVVSSGRTVASSTNVQVAVIPGNTCVITYSSLPGIDEYGVSY